MRNFPGRVPEAADTICDIADTIRRARDAVIHAENNKNEAQRLNSIHDLGQTVLESFQSDLESAKLNYEEHDNLMPNLCEIGFNPFAAPAKKEDELIYAAPHELVSNLSSNIENSRQLALKDYLNWRGPVDFDRRNANNRFRGDTKSQLFLDQLKGTVAITLLRDLSPEISTSQEPNIYLICGLTDDCEGKGYPNPRFRVIDLLPRELNDPEAILSEKHLSLIVRGRSEIDAEQLGLISNCYFYDGAFYGAFESAHGHTLGYRGKNILGPVSVPYPGSGNASDIKIDNPQTPAEHLVKLALERLSLHVPTSA